LDPLTEQEVISIFNRELKDKTLIWITHHLQGVEAMDQIIFIEDGTIEMKGSLDYLRKTNERYQKLKAIDEGRYNKRQHSKNLVSLASLFLAVESGNLSISISALLVNLAAKSLAFSTPPNSTTKAWIR